MENSFKNTLSIIGFILILVIAGKYLIQKSDERSPKFTVVIANTEIKVGEQISESVVEPMIVPASLVKTNAFYWSPDESDAAKNSEINRIQLQKVIGTTVTKLLNRGDQVTVTGVK